MYVLAFDLSTSTVGYSIFKNNELIEISYFKYPDEYEDLLDKGFYLEQKLREFTTKYKIEYFAIEERLKKFAGTKSSINHILKLAQLNYICQYLVKNMFNLKIFEINVLKARGKVYPEIFKITRGTDVLQKEYIFSKVKDELGEKIFPTKVMKSGKNKGKTQFLEEGKDMADSYVVGKAFLSTIK